MTDRQAIRIEPELFATITDIHDVPIDDPRLPWNADDFDRYAAPAGNA